MIRRFILGLPLRIQSNADVRARARVESERDASTLEIHFVVRRARIGEIEVLEAPDHGFELVFGLSVERRVSQSADVHRRSKKGKTTKETNLGDFAGTV